MIQTKRVYNPVERGDGARFLVDHRGVRDTHSIMKVNVMHGVFQKDQSVRNEFLTRLGAAKVGIY